MDFFRTSVGTLKRAWSEQEHDGDQLTFDEDVEPAFLAALMDEPIEEPKDPNVELVKYLRLT